MRQVDLFKEKIADMVRHGEEVLKTLENPNLSDERILRNYEFWITRLDTLYDVQNLLEDWKED
jgi:hypothetical protein